MFGYARAELIGRSVRILIPPERQAEEEDILGRVRRGERSIISRRCASPKTVGGSTSR